METHGPACRRTVRLVVDGPMLRYTCRRLLEMIPTTLGILLLTFVLFHVVGGSPAQVIKGKNASAESLAAFDARYGYDKPLFWGHWARVRALDDRKPDDRKPVLEPAGRVPLAYALPAGTYRLVLDGVTDARTLSAVFLLQSLDGGPLATNTLAGAVRGGAWQGEFIVPAEQRATTIVLAGAAPRALRLRRRTEHFFDSQLGHFLAGLARGDLGESAEYSASVGSVLRQGIGPSLAITVPILAGGTLLAVMLGILCALWRGGGTDRAILFVSTLLMSVNYVVWVLAGQYFLSYRLHLFPIWGFENWTYVLLPVLIGVVGGLGRDIRFYRAVILDEIYKPYVRTAWAKGLTGAQVMTRHVLRNSLIPIVTYVSLAIPFLFTGSLLLESFYGIPGLGCVSINALHSYDMAVVRAVVIVGALLYQGVNLMTDLCYAWLDPRVRLE
jgi:peptide/nickel transport system permease protein